MIQLTRNVKHVCGMVREDDWDWTNCNSGMERSGKTVFSLWFAMICTQFGGLKFDWKNLSTVFFAEPDLSRKLMEVPNGSCVIVDEGGENFYSRRSIEKRQIALVQTLMAYASKNIMLQINIPGWRNLDKFLRQERLKSLAIIKTRSVVVPDGQGGMRSTRGRGGFSLYPRKQILRASRAILGKEVKLSNPAFFGYFPDFKYYYPEIWKTYMKKKWAYLNAKKEYNADTERLKVDNETGGFMENG